jgi:hypothetical protein
VCVIASAVFSSAHEKSDLKLLPKLVPTLQTRVLDIESCSATNLKKKEKQTAISPSKVVSPASLLSQITMSTISGEDGD